MSEDWKVGFQRALIDAIIKNGSPLAPNPSYYGGWIDRNWRIVSDRVHTGEIDYERCSWVESDWYEFKGTFYEGDEREVGIDLTIVMTDGAEYKYRYSGSVGDLILAVAREA